MPPEERAEFLRRNYAENPGLRDRLLQIAQAVSSLETETKTAPLPSSDAERARVMELAFTRQECAGATIGPYKLIQELGEGGFGVVWLAEQHEPIRRRVALKIIKGGMDTREVIARFEVERQSLALMDHPGIARVFDAGTTESGRPYFVMELVRGTPITRYCDENRLPVEARLRLFISVCRAVQHAHQKGVIHRDLKPSNIIVTQHDGVAAAKIIDFGIAKATGSELTERTLFTRFHAFIGTPAYTSPEQMEMSGLDVDTRSDIYSLGVLLFELLAGRPPFDPAQLLKSSLEEMRRTIREVEPATPSQSVRELPDVQRKIIAGGRRSTPEALGGALRGDLDWIVMHCLEKDRTRRYETASGLAADVCRYLDSETVTARPASAAYRLAKFVRRNRLAVVAGVAVVLSLTTGLIVASIALIREHAALNRESELRVEADAAADMARTEAAKSEQTALFMKEMLRGAGPSAARGRDTAMLREILDTTAARLDAELAGRPEVATDLRETLALVNRDLGRFKEAETLLAQVVESRRSLDGEGSAPLAGALSNHGVALARLGKNEEADARFREALAIRRALHGEDDLSVAETMFEMAQINVADRSMEESREVLLRVLEIQRKAYGSEHVAVARTLESLGEYARVMFGHEEAVELHRQAVAMYRRTIGNDHPDLARALDSLGYSIRHVGWTDEARAPHREAFFIRRKILGAEHPDLVVSMLRYAGGISRARAAESEIAVIRDFVGEQREKLPARSTLRIPALFAYASLLDRPGGDPSRAAELVREANALLDEAVANGTPIDAGVADAMSLHGWWKFLDGEAAEAIPMCEAGLRALRVVYANRAGPVIQGNHILGWVYLSVGENSKAAERFEEAIGMIRRINARRHVFLGMDLGGFGEASRESARAKEVVDILQKAAEEWKWGRDPEVPFPRSAPVAFFALGRLLRDEGRLVEAEHALRESLRGYDDGALALVGKRVLPRGRVETCLGVVLAEQGRFEEAEPLLLHAHDDLVGNRPSFAGDGDRIVRESRDAIIAFYKGRGMHEEAARWEAAEAATTREARL